MFIIFHKNSNIQNVVLILIQIIIWPMGIFDNAVKFKNSFNKKHNRQSQTKEIRDSVGMLKNTEFIIEFTRCLLP